MSGQGFNAMWTAPPPPSYTDTVYINPRDYVVLSTSGGEEAFVHRDCLMESPVLRLAFCKRVPIVTDNVVVEFVREEDLVSVEAAPLPTSETGEAGESPRAPAADASGGGGEGNDVADAEDAAALTPSGAGDAAEGVSAVTPEPRYPVTLTETLQTDNTVRVLFPRLDGAQLDVVVSYLYYKRRYNRHPTEERPAFHIPTGAAFEVMRVAQTLEC